MPHVIDQIVLSAVRKDPPPGREPLGKPLVGRGGIDEIVLDAADAKTTGAVRAVEEEGAAIGKALRIDDPTLKKAKTVETYAAKTMTGRTTKTWSEFTLKVDPGNLGVLLRRTLDYSFPNQRAKVKVAGVGTDGKVEAWLEAGVWYLAGSNTCVYSNPPGELDKSLPVVQTSNRRLRDDEFLVSRKFTSGKSAIRVRVEFMPVEIPLLPGRALPELAWSEMRYQAFCYRMPDFRPATGAAR